MLWWRTETVPGFGFLAANDEHVGNFLHLRVANFGLQLFVAVVEMRAEARGAQFAGDFLGVLGEFFAERQHFRLHGREPHGKRAGVVLDQDAEEALDRAPQRAMHHQRLVAVAVFADVFQAKAAGQIEIELHGGELPRAADGVDELDVDFRAVKRRFAFHAFERHAQFGKRVLSAPVERPQSSAEPA